MFKWPALVFLILAMASENVYCWTDSGHRVAARIAYARLHPSAKERVDAIVQAAAYCYPTIHSLEDLSCLADKRNFKEDDLLFTDAHYVTLPFDPQNTLSEHRIKKMWQKINRQGVVLSLYRAERIIKEESIPVKEKVKALAYLCHVIADLHQPLHCCSKFSKMRPLGDKGGNLFKLKPTAWSKAKNLHALWDEGVGLLPRASNDAVDKVFYALERCDAPSLAWDGSYSFICKESYSIAVEYVYGGGIQSKPTKSYKMAAEPIVLSRLFLAGIRLADVINGILDGTRGPFQSGELPL